MFIREPMVFWHNLILYQQSGTNPKYLSKELLTKANSGCTVNLVEKN
jgi:hypothetical protein